MRVERLQSWVWEQRGQLARFAESESGATAVEYAVVAVGIGIAILTSVDAVGTAVNAIFETDLAPLF